MDFGPEMWIDLLIRAPVVLLSLTIHEFMHGYVAYRCGDDTAYRAGRLTLNPLAHLDPIGTICLFFGPIGWAKPVPVNPYNYRHPRRDDILVSGAGIAANFLIAAVFALVARVLVLRGFYPDATTHDVPTILWAMLGNVVFLNFGLAIFNLIPLFPLDGSHILQNLLPEGAGDRFAGLRQIAPLLLLGVVLLNRHTPLLAWPIFHLIEFFGGSHGASALIESLFLFQQAS